MVFVVGLFFFYCLSYMTPITIAVLFSSESKSSGFHANERLNNSESYLANYKSYQGLCCWTDLLHCLFHAMSYLKNIISTVVEFPKRQCSCCFQRLSRLQFSSQYHET